MYITIEINCPSLSTGSLNDKSFQANGDGHLACNGLENLLNGIAGGAYDATVKVVTKDSASTINTSGADSLSVTYDLS